MPTPATPGLDLVQPDWTYRPSAPPLPARLFRIRDRLLRRAPPPAQRVLKAPATVAAWTLWFAFTPDGTLAPPQRETLARLRALGRPLLVVCAAPSPGAIPDDLLAAADALVWKDLPGFDFSAYAAGLWTLARHAPGSDALVLNDSIYGPLGDLTPWLQRMRWDLTGFTATSNLENHIQSYAFHLKAVTPARMEALAEILPRDFAYNKFWQVVVNQETRFARIASETMTVGSLTYVDAKAAVDPTLQLPIPMVAAGFPFLKRSLLGKFAKDYDQDEITALLGSRGYPFDAL